jgi:hypothetical protein
MSDNPFQMDPYQSNTSEGSNRWAPDKSAGDPGRQAALQRVGAPALLIIVMMAISMVLAVLNFAGRQAGLFPPPQIPPNADPAMRQQLETLFQALDTIAVVTTVSSLVIGTLIIYAMLKMRRLESYGLSLTGTILAMLPCISPCCLLGFPLGIWALIVLLEEDVKRYFQ